MSVDLLRGVIRRRQKHGVKGWMGAHAMLVLGMCLLSASGCLRQRLTPAQVVRHAQAALVEMRACRSILRLDIDTDLLKDSVSLEVVEQLPGSRKVRVLSAETPQLQGLAFTTDGEQSMFYSPHAHQVLVGPAGRVKMPLVIERLLEARTDWIRRASLAEAAIVAKERKEGLVVYEVHIPLSAAGYVRVAVDARQWWVRQITYQDEYLGRGQITVLEIACFPELDAAQFVLDIPGDAPITDVSMEDSRPLTMEEAQRVVPFPLRTPVYLPSGTEFAAAYRLDKNVALVYTGERPFRLVQGPGNGHVPGEQATPVPLRGQQAAIMSDIEGDGWVLTWREDGLQFAVAGMLDQAEIIRIAESLELASRTAEMDGQAGRDAGQGR